MPIFEFACKECQYEFNLLISNADKDQVRCSACGSVNVKQLLSLLVLAAVKLLAATAAALTVQPEQRLRDVETEAAVGTFFPAFDIWGDCE
jgi:putative FmdB family regulatory protein